MSAWYAVDMTSELLGTIVGGAIGVVATLVGTVFTYWLTVGADRRKERSSEIAALSTCRLEAASVGSALRTMGATTVPPLVATEQLIRGGMLADVQVTTARELLLFSMVVHDLDRTFATIETIASSLIVAGEGKTMNATLVVWRNRSEKLAATAAERAEIVVKVLGDEIAST